MSQRKLGRGLNSLLKRKKRDEPAETETPAELPEASAAAHGWQEEALEEEVTRASHVRQLSIGEIEPNPFQPRLSYDHEELESLKASISKEGVLQPVLVRTSSSGSGFELVAGERRFRASRDLGLDRIPAIVIDVADERLLELALIENLHREDLNPIDAAKAFKRLLELKGWTQEDLARNLGLARPTVSNALRLLDLPQRIQKALGRGQIQPGHAKVLLSVDDATDQERLFDKIAEERMSVRELEEERDSTPPRSGSKNGSGKTRRPRSRGKPANVVDLERELSEALGTKVEIQQKKGKGVVRVEFYSPDDFETIRKLLLAGRKKR